ncbi:SPL family radical SAM protein [Sulfurospirillum sp. 1612]|uniref:SPL family radical SAM protein n=1 Tax=Sulfurospirillum sp. 1612 TaxID=3094835 RepID=UPI002F931925
MENYKEKFERDSQRCHFTRLDDKTQDFLRHKAYHYRFSFQELKQLVDMSIDFEMWHEKSVYEIWADKENRKQAFAHIKQIWEALKNKPKSYANFEKEAPYNFSRKIHFAEFEKEELGLGSCPVASPKTRCCNLMTLDAVESCGFDCSYCSIQSFYNENKIGFDKNFAQKLKNLKLDPNKNYHIGTGQSSDSLLWGNKAGIMDALFDFARENPNVILEFKSKSDNIKYLLDHDVPKNILCTWSINTPTIIKNEEHLSASLENRIKSARALADKGVLVGFHFHPIVVYENYLNEYRETIETITSQFSHQEVALVSFGTLTFIKPVIKKLRNRDFKSKILQMPLVDASGKFSYPLETKLEMFQNAYQAFAPWHQKVYFYLCMEDQSLWKPVFGYEYESNDEMEHDMVTSYNNKVAKLAR